ncbi:Uncharacterised protein [uncultured archaeon]|nr:Uncharacterised protein [uncultured archaeon]
MIRESMIHLLLLTLLLVAGLGNAQPFHGSGNEIILQQAQGQEYDAAASKEANSSTTSNASSGSLMAEAALTPASPSAEASEETAPPNESAPNLNYIWSVMGIETGQVIMVLSQNGRDLYGSAKYEPDSGEAWNGAVSGTADGDKVSLVITAQKGDKEVASRLTGTFDAASQTIKGNILQVSEGQVTAKGNFEAMWINPDTSSYIPASVTTSNVVGASGTSASESGASTGSTNPQSSAENAVPAANASSRYHDVHQYADSILTGVGDISQIPIGMGGSGLY